MTRQVRAPTNRRARCLDRQYVRAHIFLPHSDFWSSQPSWIFKNCRPHLSLQLDHRFQLGFPPTTSSQGYGYCVGKFDWV